MKNKILIVIIFFAFFACDDEDQKMDGTYHYTFTENSELTIVSLGSDSFMKNGVTETGENLVFEYEFIKNDVKEIADDEYSETIKFEIDPAIQEFSYTTDDFPAVKLVLTELCYCAFPKSELSDRDPVGEISGKKISQTKWDVKINVIFYGDQQKVVEGVFKLK